VGDSLDAYLLPDYKRTGVVEVKGMTVFVFAGRYGYH
jgi:hypothetical protein